MDDPRLSFKDRLNARTSAWQKQHAPPTATAGQSGVTSQTALWEQKSDTHQRTQQQNPFSGDYQGSVRLERDDGYGRPPEGSKTEYRGKQAGVHISNEVVELCDYIRSLGTEQPDGTYAITFGYLFEAYTKISNKLVGMLMRARKQGLVKFKGEMLFQRRDDDVVIWLVQSPEALMEDIEHRKDELHQHAAHRK